MNDWNSVLCAEKTGFYNYSKQWFNDFLRLIHYTNYKIISTKMGLATNQQSHLNPSCDVGCPDRFKCQLDSFRKVLKTRKSSCVNARGIPTAAYQVLHPRWGTPPPGRGTPQQAYPPGRVPPLARSDEGGGLPEVEYPPSRGTHHRTWLGYPPALTWPGYPPMCGQTDWWTDTCQNITFPRTTYAIGNNVWLF